MRPQSKPVTLHVRRALRLATLAGTVALVCVGLLDPVRAQTGERRVLTLETANGSGISGEARLTGFGNQTVISIMLSDGSGEVYFPHLHDGSCDDYDGIPILPLAETVHGKRSRATVDLTLGELLSGRYLIDAHPSMGSAESLFDARSAVVCGEVAQAVLIDGDESVSTGTAATDTDTEDTSTREPDAPLTQFPDAGAGPLGPDGFVNGVLVASLTVLAAVFGAFGIQQRRRLAPTLAQLRLQALMLQSARQK